jgi:8-oxo-dGTP pyrophosphatase MutT (NUDIX family)
LGISGEEKESHMGVKRTGTLKREFAEELGLEVESWSAVHRHDFTNKETLYI